MSNLTDGSIALNLFFYLLYKILNYFNFNSSSVKVKAKICIVSQSLVHAIHLS